MGGAGYLGSALVGRLLQYFQEVHVIDKLNYGNSGVSPYIANPNYHFHYMDAADVQALTKLFRAIDPDVVVNLAALVGPVADKKRDDAVSSNVLVANQIVSLTNEKKSRRLIYASTCSNYGRSANVVNEKSPLSPISWYSETKVKAERNIIRRSEDFVLFRFGTLYGLAPRLRLDIILNEWVKMAIAKGSLEIFEPDACRPLLDVNEAARLITIAGEGNLRRGVYNAHGGNFTKGEIASLIAKMVPVKITQSHEGDARSYKVSCDKIKDYVSIKPANLIDATKRLERVIRGLDYSNPVYDNVAGYRGATVA